MMQGTLPGIERPLTLADILRRFAPPTPPAAPAPIAGPASVPLRMPAPPRKQGPSVWHRHELPELGGYELRAEGRAIVRVRATVGGCIVRNIGASFDSKPIDARAADAMAARIARLDTLA